MLAVQEECARRNLRLTPARTCVLEALLESHRAMTAYELLDRLRIAGLSSQPPVAYRALEFLVGNGFVHRVERLSAYVACTRGRRGDGQPGHMAGFLICRKCRIVAETDLGPSAAALMDKIAADEFSVERVMIEAEGLCAHCRGSAGSGQ